MSSSRKRLSKNDKLFSENNLAFFENDSKNSVQQIAEFFPQAAQDSLPGFVNR